MVLRGMDSEEPASVPPHECMWAECAVHLHILKYAKRSFVCLVTAQVVGGIPPYWLLYLFPVGRLVLVRTQACSGGLCKFHDDADIMDEYEWRVSMQSSGTPVFRIVVGKVWTPNLTVCLGSSFMVMYCDLDILMCILWPVDIFIGGRWWFLKWGKPSVDSWQDNGRRSFSYRRQSATCMLILLSIKRLL